MKKKNHVLGLSPEGLHKIAYVEWGNWSDQSPAIVCVHGLTRNKHDFDELAHYCSDQGRYLLCPDVVGRGDSDWFTDPTNYNFPQYVADMTSIIARANTQQIDWIGTSMGGLIGMMIAALPNSPIRKLVLNDIGPQIPLTGLKRLGKYAGKKPIFRNLYDAIHYCKINYADFGILSEQQWETFTAHSIKQTTEGYVFKSDPAISRSKPLSKWLKELLLHPTKALEGILYDIDLWPIWHKIKCPVLVIHGKRSDILTSEIITTMRQIQASMEIYEIENAGHAPALLDGTTHETILQWLAK